MSPHVTLGEGETLQGNLDCVQIEKDTFTLVNKPFCYNTQLRCFIETDTELNVYLANVVISS